MGKGLETTIAVLNGLVGNYLSRKSNGLATDMSFYHRGSALRIERAALSAAYPHATPRLVVLVHGWTNTESIWQLPDGTDYGARLERDLGWTAAYLRYNTGLAIADNGARFAELLEALVTAYPVALEELLLIGFSMGGLVIRSACHAAVTTHSSWLSRVHRIIYIGTPHLGATSERLGKLTSEVLRRIPNAYTRLIADIADLRSDGVQDLAHARVRHEDRALAQSPWDLRDARNPIPLLPNIEHHLIAGSFFSDSRLAFLFGDWVVSVASATYRGLAEEILPPERVHVFPGLSHVALAHSPAVYDQIKTTLERPT